MLKIARDTKTLRELTLEKMREAILSNYFRPGQRLVERTLCDELGVSRTIVREVLRHLETEGLVESVPQQGPVVATIDPRKAAEIYEIRGLLEGHAARACAEHCTAEVIAELSLKVVEIENAFNNQDFRMVLEKTTDFYKAMFIGGGKAMAWEIVQSLNARINQLRSMTIGSAGRGAVAIAEMNAILDAIKRRDGEDAHQQSLKHIQSVARLAAAKLGEIDEATGS
ncbi:GntR family transcriptional regulator [Massilia sp. METH4]|uniref:GntR family transcriptional regulator n=1 Tax=Massilia sp. METH4 TaxID=3123041 RepID=UPI0030D3C896